MTLCFQWTIRSDFGPMFVEDLTTHLLPLCWCVVLDQKMNQSTEIIRSHYLLKPPWKCGEWMTKNWTVSDRP